MSDMVHVRYRYVSRRQNTVLDEQFIEEAPEIGDKVTLEDGSVWKVFSKVSYPEVIDYEVKPYYIFRGHTMEKVFKNEQSQE